MHTIEREDVNPVKRPEEVFSLSLFFLVRGATASKSMKPAPFLRANEENTQGAQIESLSLSLQWSLQSTYYTLIWLAVSLMQKNTASACFGFPYAIPFFRLFVSSLKHVVRHMALRRHWLLSLRSVSYVCPRPSTVGVRRHVVTQSPLSSSPIMMTSTVGEPSATVQSARHFCLSTQLISRPLTRLSCAVIRGGDDCHSALLTTRRHRGFHFYLNLTDPDDTRRFVEEELARLAEEERKSTSAYLHSLLNLAMSYYQAADFITAYEFAQHTHEKALAHNARSSFVFLTAKTCAKCATALADEYEAHVAKAESMAQTSSALAAKPSVLYSAKRTIMKLHEDAQRFEAVATRVYNRPDVRFMHGYGNAKVNETNRRKYYGEARDEGPCQGTSSSQETDDRSASRESTEQSHATHTHHPHADHGRDLRRAWAEDASNVDEVYESPYGSRWQERRTRPEHVEMKRYYQKTVRGSKWKVPK